jgi:hypothetical protein
VDALRGSLACAKVGLEVVLRERVPRVPCEKLVVLRILCKITAEDQVQKPPSFYRFTSVGSFSEHHKTPLLPPRALASPAA